MIAKQSAIATVSVIDNENRIDVYCLWLSANSGYFY